MGHALDSGLAPLAVLWSHDRVRDAAGELGADRAQGRTIKTFQRGYGGFHCLFLKVYPQFRKCVAFLGIWKWGEVRG